MSYPLRYAQRYHGLIRDTGVNGVTFSRAGFTGAGTAPCQWAGDEDSTWEAFRASIIAGQTAGISGIPFRGWDLAGFSGEHRDAPCPSTRDIWHSPASPSPITPRTSSVGPQVG